MEIDPSQTVSALAVQMPLRRVEDRKRLAARIPLARGAVVLRRLMRRAALAVTGQAVALAVLAPYLVMLLTALKPEASRYSNRRSTGADWPASVAPVTA